MVVSTTIPNSIKAEAFHKYSSIHELQAGGLLVIRLPSLIRLSSRDAALLSPTHSPQSSFIFLNEGSQRDAQRVTDCEELDNV